MHYLLAMLGCAILGAAQAQKVQETDTMTARGTFDVKTIPQPADDSAAGPFARLFLDKRFHGDLDGTSRGQMMAGGTAVKGSAAYVALELIEGTLRGHHGSFILQHAATMFRGTPSKLVVTVVPDSGTGELVGLTGQMEIIIADGKHSYVFEYELPGDEAR